MKLLLIILGSRACWFRQDGDQWSQPFEEPVGTLDACGHSVSRCPYLSQPDVLVQLVFDSDFQDVQLHRLAQASSRLATWLDRRAVQRRALAGALGRVNEGDRDTSRVTTLESPSIETTDVSVAPVRLPSGRRALSIVQTQRQAELQAWLTGLQGVMFTSVRSLGHVLAVCPGSRDDRKRKGCLYVLYDAGLCRHLLYLSGRLCLARLVTVRDEAALLSGVQDTMTHLQAIGVDSCSLILRTLGLSIDAQQRLASASGCSGQSSLDSPIAQAPAPSLAEWVSSLMNPSDVTPSTLTGMALCRLASGESLSALAHAALARATPTGSSAAGAFGPLLRPWLSLLRDIRRLGLCVTALLLLCIMTWLTVVATVDRWQSAGAERATVTQLQQQIAGLRTQAGRLHASPVLAERSLLRRQAFAVAAGWPPGKWLGTLAGAMTAHEAIVIDTLEWSRQPASVIAIDGPDAAAHAEPPAFDRFGHWRRGMPSLHEPAETLVISLQGHLDASMTLREQRDQLAAFVMTLKTLEGAEGVRVDRSPIDDYAGGRRPLSAENRQVTVGRSEFLVRLRLHASERKPSVPGFATSSRPAT